MKTKLLSNDHFWKLLDLLINEESSFHVNDTAKSFSISDEIVFSLMNVLVEHDFSFESLNENEFKCIEQPEKIHGAISFLEIVKLISVRDTLERSGEKAGADLLANILKASEDKVVSFSQAINTIELRFGSIFDESNIVHLAFTKESATQKLEKAIFKRKSLFFSNKNLDEFEILPLRLVHIDGALCCVAEDIQNCDIIHFNISNIESLELMETNYAPLYSKIEIDDYLLSLRSISESEVRLILKIGDNVKINQPNYLYFANPVLVKKSSGHQIWAASVEPTEEVFEWLCSLGSQVEIIDPSAFKRMFLKYCENKLNQISA